MLELNKGDNVIIEHPHMRDSYLVAKIKEAPTAKSVVVSYFTRNSVANLTFELKDDEAKRRNRSSVIAIIDPSLDPLKVSIEVRRANELVHAKVRMVSFDQIDVVKSLASGAIDHSDSLERRASEVIQWMNTGLLADGYLTAMADRLYPDDDDRNRRAERDTIRELLQESARHYDKVTKDDERLARTSHTVS